MNNVMYIFQWFTVVCQIKIAIAFWVLVCTGERPRYDNKIILCNVKEIWNERCVVLARTLLSSRLVTKSLWCRSREPVCFFLI